MSLAHFRALRTLTLCESMPPCTEILHRLPTSLRELMIATAPGVPEQSYIFAERCPAADPTHLIKATPQ